MSEQFIIVPVVVEVPLPFGRGTPIPEPTDWSEGALHRLAVTLIRGALRRDAWLTGVVAYHAGAERPYIEDRVEMAQCVREQDREG